MKPRGPLSRRKPGPTYPLFVPDERWTPAFAGEAFDLVCRARATLFLVSTTEREMMAELEAGRARLAAVDSELAGLGVRHELAMSAFKFDEAREIQQQIAVLERERGELIAALPAPAPPPPTPAMLRKRRLIQRRRQRRHRR